MAVPTILVVVLACAIDDELPTPEECTDYYRASAQEERRLNPDPEGEARMEALCNEVMYYWNPTAPPSLQSLREKFPDVVGRYPAGGEIHFLRVNHDTREIHLDGGCPEGHISGSVFVWVKEKVEEICGVQEDPTPFPVPLSEETP